MAAITITEALKYIKSLKNALSSGKHLESYDEVNNNRVFTFTTAMSKDRYDSLISDSSCTEHALLAANKMFMALVIIEKLKLAINKKNEELGISEKMTMQSLFKSRSFFISNLINKFRNPFGNNNSFTYEEALAQLTEEKKTLVCYKPSYDNNIIDQLKKEAKDCDKEAIKLGNDIAALNHTTTIEIDDNDLFFIEDFC